jgi:hypothetical protein
LPPGDLTRTLKFDILLDGAPLLSKRSLRRLLEKPEKPLAEPDALLDQSIDG